MARVVRKQVYISAEHERKLKALAAQWRCPEAAVMRRALDELPDPEGSLHEKVKAILAAAGMLAPPPDDSNPPLSEEELEELDREYDEWLASRHEPIGLGEAIEDDRNSR